MIYCTALEIKMAILYVVKIVTFMFGGKRRINYERRIRYKISKKISKNICG
jgi:hypothetical protein